MSWRQRRARTDPPPLIIEAAGNLVVITWYLFRDPWARCDNHDLTIWYLLRDPWARGANRAADNLVVTVWYLFRDPWARRALPPQRQQGGQE